MLPRSGLASKFGFGGGGIATAMIVTKAAWDGYPGVYNGRAAAES